MRSVIMIICLLAGAGSGLAASLHDGWGTRIVMMLLGAMVAAPVGAALSKRARGRSARRQPLEEGDSPHGTSAESLAANFWRDRGHAPFMRPPGGPPDHHQLDPDRMH